ncbi:NAD(P)H-dependent flavin oxidoreductase [Microvirga zambiensis]|uniref:NAD(P)H-dependent flavin oxidoreductase n=1 Tax=Microvirga zambiensis TaxID=1402137 RepID=UPI00191EEA5B|nr:nitronate monooxygenase family protein [Microvirga zambiensis]
MPLPSLLRNLRLPLIGAPMFIVSGPDLVIAQCKSGVVGSFPALNAREKEGEPVQLELWLQRINEELDRHNQESPENPAAPFAVNLIVHRSNIRLERDIEILTRWKVPIWITSLGARPDVNAAAHAAGAITLHDVINDRFARKAIEKGADGLIAVAAGAGGHAGALSPFALIQEIRGWYDGPLALSGAIARGDAILAAQALGADLAYVGSAFIATREANATAGHKQAIVDAAASDILYTDYFTGVHGNYLAPSIRAAGLDPDALPKREGNLDFSAKSEKPKAWRDIWGAGQGVGALTSVVPAADLINRLHREYRAAAHRIAELGFAARELESTPA